MYLTRALRPGTSYPVNQLLKRRQYQPDLGIQVDDTDPAYIRAILVVNFDLSKLLVVATEVFPVHIQQASFIYTF